jgi:chromosome segregation ATPase
MATISERLEALESLLAESATLQDRIEALETQLQAFTEDMVTGEMRFQSLQALPDGRGKSIADETGAITDAFDRFNKSMQELAEPFDQKLLDLQNRLKSLETMIGIES